MKLLENVDVFKTKPAVELVFLCLLSTDCPVASNKSRLFSLRANKNY